MIGHAYVRTNLSILAEMLHRTNISEALPIECDAALQPIDETENMICGAMAGEFGIMENLDVSLGSDLDNQDHFSYRLSKALLYDHKHTVGKVAPFYASSCSTEMREAAKLNKTLFFFSEGHVKCDMIEWMSNPIGCNLLMIAAPDYNKYPGRRLDQSAQITAMQNLLWLRQQNASADNAEEKFKERPENLKAFSDRISINKAKATIDVQLLSPSSDGEKIWSLPLLLAEKTD